MPALSVPPALRLRGHRHLAPGGAGGLHPHALSGHQRQHHVPGGHRHRHRGHGGRGHRHDRERPQAPGAFPPVPRAGAAGGRALAGDRRGLLRGGVGPLLLPAHHYPELPARVRPPGPGGATLRAPGLHQDLCHGRRGRAGGDPGAGAHGLLHPRPYPPRRNQSPQPGPDPALPTAAPGRAGGAAGHHPAIHCDPVQSADPALRHRRSPGAAEVALPGRGSGAGGGSPPARHRHHRGLAGRAGAVLAGGDPGHSRAGGPGRGPGFGVHARALRGRSHVHAHHIAGPLHRQGPGALAADRPADRRRAGGGTGLRQDRPGRYGHGPGAPDHDRDPDPAQAGVRVAPGDDRPQADRRAGSDRRLPRRHQRLGDAHQDAHRYVGHRHQDPRGHQGRGAGDPGDRTHRQGHRGGGTRGSGDRIRLLGTGGGGALSGDPPRPDRGSQGRAQYRRHQPGGGRRRGGHQYHPDGGGAGALSGQSTLSQGAARRPGQAAGTAPGHPYRRPDPPGPGRRGQGRRRGTHAQERERAPERLDLRRHPGRGRRHLCPPGQGGGTRPGTATPRLLHHLVRPVRIHAPGPGAAHPGGPLRPGHHLQPALSHLPPHRGGPAGHALPALRPDRRLLVRLSAGLQPVGGGGGGLHRPGRGRGGVRRRDAGLPGQCPAGISRRGQVEPGRRPPGGHHGRGRHARAAQGHDRGRHHRRVTPHHARPRHRLRGHAPYRRPHGGRHDYRPPVVPVRDPGHLSGVAAAGDWVGACSTRRVGSE